MSITVTIKPAGGGDYASIDALIAAIIGGTYGLGSLTIVAVCSAGSLATAPNWSGLDAAGFSAGTVNLTLQGATALADPSDSNPYVAINLAPRLSSTSAIGSLTVDGIQFGNSTTKGKLNLFGTMAATAVLTVKNCVFWLNVDAGASAHYSISATSVNGVTLNIYNNYLYVAVNQNAGGDLPLCSIAVGTLNFWHNAICNKNTTAAFCYGLYFGGGNGTACLADIRYNAFLGPIAGTGGFFQTNSGTGTVTIAGASDYNVTCDTTGTTYSPGGHGLNSKTTANAWSTLGSRALAAGSVLAGIGTVSPVPKDCVGTPRPQLNLVDSGPYEIVRRNLDTTDAAVQDTRMLLLLT